MMTTEYKSPVEILIDKQTIAFENELIDGIHKIAMNYGINVDKEELIKALKYDRDQYQWGYEHGKKDAVIHAHWISGVYFDNDEVAQYDIITCSHCQFPFTGDEYRFITNCHSNFCPECGAKMYEKSEEQ